MFCFYSTEGQLAIRTREIDADDGANLSSSSFTHPPPPPPPPHTHTHHHHTHPGLIHGFGDLAAIVKGAVTCDRTVLDKLPYRDSSSPGRHTGGFSPRPGGAVDPEKLERVLDAQARGLFREEGRRREDKDGRTLQTSSSSSSSSSSAAAAAASAAAAAASPRSPEQSSDNSNSFWSRRRFLSSLPLPPNSAAVSTWSLPEEAEAEAQRHRLGPPSAKKESAGKGLALIAALNVALLYAGSRAPTG